MILKDTGDKMKLQLINNTTYMISIPKEIVKINGWKKGDILGYEFTREGKMYIFKK